MSQHKVCRGTVYCNLYYTEFILECFTLQFPQNLEVAVCLCCQGDLDGICGIIFNYCDDTSNDILMLFFNENNPNIKVTSLENEKQF